MLRASMQSSGIDFDLESIGKADVDPGRQDARDVLRFTDALVTHSPSLDEARAALASTLGEQAVPFVSAAVGNFEMMNRILDATGVPVPRSMAAIAVEIGIEYG